MKYFTLLLIFLFASCDEPLSKRETEKTYTREFSNKDKSKISSYSREWLFKNLEQVDFQNLQDQTIVAGNAKDVGFDSDSKLFYKFYLKAEDNKYNLTLKADYKEVKSFNHDTGSSSTETEDIKESDKDEIHKLFNEIDRKLYNHILIIDQGGSL